MEVNEDHMEVDEDQALSADSDCISDCSENSTEFREKIVSVAEINALNVRSTKFCIIYSYYSRGGCFSCMYYVHDCITRHG